MPFRAFPKMTFRSATVLPPMVLNELPSSRMPFSLLLENVLPRMVALSEVMPVKSRARCRPLRLPSALFADSDAVPPTTALAMPSSRIASSKFLFRVFFWI